MANRRWLSADRRVFNPVVSLFEPDTLTVQQYLDRWQGTGHSYIQPEKRLMFAVLQEAVECFQEHVLLRNRKEEELFRDVEQWILEDDVRWPFYFLNICETFGFDPHYLRSGLSRWKQQTIREKSRRTRAYVQRKTG